MLPQRVAKALCEVGRRLVAQSDARVLVPARLPEPGFWFGAGNICRDRDGALLLCGRYRNGGDSRTGVEAGPRGAELAVFRSTDGGETFQHALSLLKDDVAPAGEQVISIEGSRLRRAPDGLELYVASEKARPYPPHVADRQKPGTGIWSIDVLRAPTLDGLLKAQPQPVLRSQEATWLHVKDPVVFETGGRVLMVFSSHPFSWASSNTGLAAQREDGAFAVLTTEFLPRGPAWDVAITRVTERLPLPAMGVLAQTGLAALYFYDGGECMKDLGGGGRPRGHSCEELGGLAAALGDGTPAPERLSVEEPLFVSPYGTGCSRYVSVFEAEDGYLVTWQQSQPDGSQPLVVNRVPRSAVEAILAGGEA